MSNAIVRELSSQPQISTIRNRRIFAKVIWIAFISGSCFTSSAATYDASQGTVPTSQGWQLRDQGGSANNSMSGGHLRVGPTSTGGDYAYYRSGVGVDFNGGFTMQGTIQVIDSGFRTQYQDAGWMFTAVDAGGNRVDLGVAQNKVILRSGQTSVNAQEVSVTTTGWVDYSVVVFAGTVTLYVNGSNQATVSVVQDSGIGPAFRNTAYFGDTVADLSCTVDVQSFSYDTSVVGPVNAKLLGLAGGYQPQAVRLRLDAADLGTTGTNTVKFPSVASGAHTLRGYQNGGTPFGEEMWAIKAFNTTNGQSTNITLVRNLPYVSGSFVFKDATTLQTITSTTVGQTVRLEIPLTQSSGALTPCRMRVVLDQNQTGSYDYDVTNALFNISGPSGTATAVVLWTPTNAATFKAAYSVLTDMGGSDGWVNTDSGTWFSHPVFSVQPPPTLGFDYCLPEGQQTLDWSNTVSYVMHVYELASGTNVPGANITVVNGMTGQSYASANQTDANGVITIPITVPDNQPNGVYDIALTATKTSYTNSATLHRAINVQHSTNAAPTEFGTTVITHGFMTEIIIGGITYYNGNAEGWMNQMGTSILKKAGRGRLWRFNAGNDTLEDVTPADITTDDTGEQVIYVRWEQTANNGLPIFGDFQSPAGEAEAVGHQIYSLLIGGAPKLGGGNHDSFVGPANAPRPLHLIGHSFGTVVISEAIQRLGLAGIQVEQMTTLDPHDWDEGVIPVDGAGLLPDVHVWSNVQRADNYFNKKGPIFGSSPLCPHGRPIAGALNTDLSDFENFFDGWGSGPHSSVWAFYLGTIDASLRGTKVDGVDILVAPWYTNFPGPVGFNLSRLAHRQGTNQWDTINPNRQGGDSLTNPPANSSRTNAPHSIPGEGDITRDPPKAIFNGDFWMPYFPNFADLDLTDCIDTESPGFSTWVALDQFGIAGGLDYAARLDFFNRRLATHLNYVPGNASVLRFAVATWEYSILGDDDQLVVKFNDTEIARFNLSQLPTDYTWVEASVASVQGKSGVFSFTLDGHAVVDSRVVIDEIDFSYTTAPCVSVQVGNVAAVNFSSPIDFGGFIQAAPTPQKLCTIKNIGGVTLTIANLQVPLGFTIVGTPPTSIAAGASGSFYIQMNTATLGTKAGNVTFTCNDPNQPNFSFPITGLVVAPATPPAISIFAGAVAITNGQTSPVISIGSALVGGTGLVQTFTIRNDGDQSLTLGTITPPAGFTVVSNPPASLTNGQTGTFQVLLNTGTIGTVFGDLAIANNDSARNPFTFRISGTVLATTGSLTVNLSPAEAIAGGAQWRVDGGAWTNSGVTVSGLAATNHTVEFSGLPFWHSPSAVTLSTSAGQSRSLTRYYVPYSRPVLGQISFLPSRSVQGSVSGDAGVPIIVERSPDMQNWSPVTTNTAGVFDFYDYSANGNSKLFYRGRYQ